MCDKGLDNVVGRISWNKGSESLPKTDIVLDVKG